MNTMNLTDEEKTLVDECRAKKKADAFVPKSYTDSEKCRAFDKLYKMALDELDYAQTNGCESKDFSHWCFEAVMNLLGPKIWDAYNEAR